MLAVLICTLFNLALLLGLLVGITVGFFRARQGIAAALAFAPPVVSARRSLA